MIRRPCRGQDQAPLWILISQQAHAQVAADLARHWSIIAPLEPREPVLEAVRIHDDGWKTWDAAPEVDDQGRPLAFNEMPLHASLAIWEQSIQLAHHAGDLAQYLVASHFRGLLQRFDSWRAESSNPAIGDQFLAREQQRADAALKRWLTGPDRHAEMARRAVAHLQLFDAMSLWLCRAERTSALAMETPDGPVVTLTPILPHRIVLDPWPFSVETLHITATGRSIRATVYRSKAALKQAPAAETLLQWTLLPPQTA